MVESTEFYKYSQTTKEGQKWVMDLNFSSLVWKGMSWAFSVVVTRSIPSWGFEHQNWELLEWYQRRGHRKYIQKVPFAPWRATHSKSPCRFWDWILSSESRKSSPRKLKPRICPSRKDVKTEARGDKVVGKHAQFSFLGLRERDYDCMSALMGKFNLTK